MKINDKVLRITAISELKPNSKTWKPVVTKTPVSDSYGEPEKNQSILEESLPSKGNRY